MLDSATGELRLPQRLLATAGKRRVNGICKLEDERTGKAFDPLLMLDPKTDELVTVSLPEFSAEHGDSWVQSLVPVRKIKTPNGDVYATTAFELLVARYPVNRDVKPAPYDEPEHSYSRVAGEIYQVSGDVVIRFAGEWATTAEKSGGKYGVIIGAGIR
ncbi:MAG: hypothetical protein IPK53_12375 [bacterium]|nr:hypothetical protein [bacterium]